MTAGHLCTRFRDASGNAAPPPWSAARLPPRRSADGLPKRKAKRDRHLAVAEVDCKDYSVAAERFDFTCLNNSYEPFNSHQEGKNDAYPATIEAARACKNLNDGTGVMLEHYERIFDRDEFFCGESAQYFNTYRENVSWQVRYAQLNPDGPCGCYMGPGQLVEDTSTLTVYGVDSESECQLHCERLLSYDPLADRGMSVGTAKVEASMRQGGPWSLLFDTFLVVRQNGCTEVASPLVAMEAEFLRFTFPTTHDYEPPDPSQGLDRAKFFTEVASYYYTTVGNWEHVFDNVNCAGPRSTEATKQSVMDTSTACQAFCKGTNYAAYWTAGMSGRQPGTCRCYVNCTDYGIEENGYSNQVWQTAEDGMCSDDCAETSSDCQDGWTGSAGVNKCAYGTDCTDCGLRRGSASYREAACFSMCANAGFCCGEDKTLASLSITGQRAPNCVQDATVAAEPLRGHGLDGDLCATAVDCRFPSMSCSKSSASVWTLDQTLRCIGLAVGEACEVSEMCAFDLACVAGTCQQADVSSCNFDQDCGGDAMYGCGKAGGDLALGADPWAPNKCYTQFSMPDGSYVNRIDLCESLEAADVSAAFCSLHTDSSGEDSEDSEEEARWLFLLERGQQVVADSGEYPGYPLNRAIDQIISDSTASTELSGLDATSTGHHRCGDEWVIGGEDSVGVQWDAALGSDSEEDPPYMIVYLGARYEIGKVAICIQSSGATAGMPDALSGVRLKVRRGYGMEVGSLEECKLKCDDMATSPAHPYDANCPFDSVGGACDAGPRAYVDCYQGCDAAFGEPKMDTQCNNVCNTSYNGICEDGGGEDLPDGSRLHSCAYASDCSDCAERTDETFCSVYGVGCSEGHFCNYASGSYGTCEQCQDFPDCFMNDVPQAISDCNSRCCKRLQCVPVSVAAIDGTSCSSDEDCPADPPTGLLSYSPTGHCRCRNGARVSGSCYKFSAERHDLTVSMQDVIQAIQECNGCEAGEHPPFSSVLPLPGLAKGNSLEGTLPKELGDLTKLDTLVLGDNQLAGTMPPELGLLVNLTTL
eukprot:gene1472-2098_t